MGLFHDIKGLKAANRIRSGCIEEITLAQMVNMLINLPDAKRKLSEAQYNQVYALYKEFRKCKTPWKVDAEAYCDLAIKMIKRFDVIAPYEMYSGGNEMEYSIFMEDVRNGDVDDEVEDVLDDENELGLDEGDRNYASYIVEQSKNFHRILLATRMH